MKKKKKGRFGKEGEGAKKKKKKATLKVWQALLLRLHKKKATQKVFWVIDIMASFLPL